MFYTKIYNKAIIDKNQKKKYLIFFKNIECFVIMAVLKQNKALFMKDISKKTFFTIDSFILSNMILNQYNLDSFEIIELAEDASYSSENINNTIFDKYDFEDFKKILEQKWCNKEHIDLILNKLCQDGVIDSGNYIITND